MVWHEVAFRREPRERVRFLVGMKEKGHLVALSISIGDAKSAIHDARGGLDHVVAKSSIKGGSNLCTSFANRLNPRPSIRTTM
jgi:hypothetical protein